MALVVGLVRVESIGLAYLGLELLPASRAETFPAELDCCQDIEPGQLVYWRCDDAGVVVGLARVTCCGRGDLRAGAFTRGRDAGATRVGDAGGCVL